MEYIASIKEKEYFFPGSVYMLNEEKLKKYSYEQDDTTLIDLNKLGREADYKDLDLLSFQCADFVGEMVLDDEYDLQKHNELGPKMRFLDDISKIHISKGEEEKAREDQMKMIELEIDFYNKLKEQENSNKKSSR